MVKCHTIVVNCSKIPHFCGKKSKYLTSCGGLVLAPHLHLIWGVWGVILDYTSKVRCILHLIIIIHMNCFIIIYFDIGDTSTRSSSIILNIFHRSFESFPVSGFSLLNTITIFGVWNFSSAVLYLSATIQPFLIFSNTS